MTNKVKDELLDEPVQERWHVSKSVPLALVMGLVTGFFAQTMTIVWFAASLNNQTVQNSKDIVELRAQAKISSEDDRKILVALGQLDERSQALKDLMDELRRMLTSNMRFGQNGQGPKLTNTP